MIDFTCGDLLAANKKVLEKLDELIYIYQDRKMPTLTITLSGSAYEALDKNLKNKTDGKQSLGSHSYRGYKLAKEIK